MNKAFVCILLCLAPFFSKAQNYSEYASSFYNGASDEFAVSSVKEGDYRIYKIKNISFDTYTICLFAKTKSGKWVLVGGATLNPGKKAKGLEQKDGTDKTLIFYYLGGHREKLPTAEEVNRVESSY